MDLVLEQLDFTDRLAQVRSSSFAPQHTYAQVQATLTETKGMNVPHFEVGRHRKKLDILLGQLGETALFAGMTAFRERKLMQDDVVRFVGAAQKDMGTTPDVADIEKRLGGWVNALIETERVMPREAMYAKQAVKESDGEGRTRGGKQRKLPLIKLRYPKGDEI